MARRLIWIGSIVFFQIVELVRYFNGQTYRPFFGLYAAILFALVLWCSPFWQADQAALSGHAARPISRSFSGSVKSAMGQRRSSARIAVKVSYGPTFDIPNEGGRQIRWPHVASRPTVCIREAVNGWVPARFSGLQILGPLGSPTASRRQRVLLRVNTRQKSLCNSDCGKYPDEP